MFVSLLSVSWPQGCRIRRVQSRGFRRSAVRPKSQSSHGYEQSLAWVHDHRVRLARTLQANAPLAASGRNSLVVEVDHATAEAALIDELKRLPKVVREGLVS